MNSIDNGNGDASSTSSSTSTYSSPSESTLSLAAAEASVRVDVLTLALLMASILYAFCLVLAERKLVALHSIRPELSTKKLLVLSVAVVCAVRIMTILGVAAMNMANVRAHYSLQPISRRKQSTEADDGGRGNQQQQFYDNSMTVLFDLPNCIVVSTYVLLTLVWAECFMESRFHTESAVHWKRLCLRAYNIFTSILYGTQLTLYGCIFLASGTVIRTVLYAAITGINFTAVSLVLILYINLNTRFSVSDGRMDGQMDGCGLGGCMDTTPFASSIICSHSLSFYSTHASCIVRKGVSISVTEFSQFLEEDIYRHCLVEYDKAWLGRRHLVGLCLQD